MFFLNNTNLFIKSLNSIQWSQAIFSHLVTQHNSFDSNFLTPAIRINALTTTRITPICPRSTFYVAHVYQVHPSWANINSSRDCLARQNNAVPWYETTSIDCFLDLSRRMPNTIYPISFSSNVPITHFGSHFMHQSSSNDHRISRTKKNGKKRDEGRNKKQIIKKTNKKKKTPVSLHPPFSPLSASFPIGRISKIP